MELHKFHIFKNKKESVQVINSTASLLKSKLEKKGFKLIYVIDALNKEDALKIFKREITFDKIKLTQPLGI